MIKRYTDKDYADKAIEANQLGKMLYILTHDEETEIEVPDYDEDGNPIMIEYEDTEIVVDYSDDGTAIGTHEITVIKHKQKTHTETVTETVAELVIADVNYYICYEANYTDGTLNPDFDTDRINALRNSLNDENTQKAKEAVENGYVEYKDAQFETNAQTVGDLTATMLLMQSSGMETYSWLSKDDKVVELTLEDFGILGGLIAGFKAHIWNEEYLGYKEEIEEAQTYEELKEITIHY